MFTYKRTKDKQDPLFYIGEKPVYTQFKKDDKLRIPPFRDTKKYLDSDEFRERYGEQYWKPAPLLQKLAEEGKTFAKWDKEKQAG
jgi:hypothetical protein